MPIRAENKALYPKDWPAISQAVREEAGWRCEECGVKNGDLGGRLRDRARTWCPAQPTGENGLSLTWPTPGEFGWCSAATGPVWLKIVRIVLTVAHLDHDPRNCARKNLRAWCQRCHNRYDAKTRAAGIKARKKATAARGDLFPAKIAEPG